MNGRNLPSRVLAGPLSSFSAAAQVPPGLRVSQPRQAHSTSVLAAGARAGAAAAGAAGLDALAALALQAHLVVELGGLLVVRRPAGLALLVEEQVRDEVVPALLEHMVAIRCGACVELDLFLVCSDENVSWLCLRSHVMMNSRLEVTLEMLLALEGLGTVGVGAPFPPGRNVAHLHGAAVEDGAVLVDLDGAQLPQRLHVVLVLLQGQGLALDLGEDLAAGAVAVGAAVRGGGDAGGGGAEG